VCGRFVAASSPQLLAERFGVDEIRLDESALESREPRYNVAPRAEVMIVRQRDGRRVLSPLRWGLVPSWADDPSIGDHMINARAEGIANRPAFKRAFERRRCIVPADAFYEWETLPSATRSKRSRKRPMLIRRRDGEPLAMAGLWEVWHEREEDDLLRTFTIVTTNANDLLAPVHDRMPVVLPDGAWERWLDPAESLEVLQALLVPASDDLFDTYIVSDRVNNADNDDPDLVRPVESDTLFS
jgi:putative SOS response-associated peptidase YedK